MKRSMAVLVVAAGLGQGCRGQGAKDWVAHKQIGGFSVETPHGWTLSADPKRGSLAIQGTNREQVMAWPVFIPGRLEGASAAPVLRKLATVLLPEARWEAAQPQGSSAIRANGRAGDRLAVSALTWVNTPKGAACYLYALAAPEAGYKQNEDTFARVLSSLRVTGAAPGSQPAAPAFVRWQDPRENAFSLEVPSGWKTSGGMFRYASVDTRAAWETVSPDGQIRITGGDSELPPFTLPTQTLAMAGFREGSWYSPGYGVNMMVRRYLPGVAFAREYVTAKAARGCSDVTFTESRERPDFVQAINAVNAQFQNLGVAISLTAGEVAFTCRQNGQAMSGYYFAGTQLTEHPAGGLWHAEYLGGFLAASGKAAEAQAVLGRIVQSIQVNPQWASMQQNIAANTSQIVSRTHEEISKIISDTYWNRQTVMDELSRRRSNATLGVEDVVDPQTGRGIKVESGSSHYWIDHRGAIVGTDTDTRPNLDFRALIRRP
jgi:hypothetical protein